ncbi:hypothetical protein GCM10009551_013100 [Nocardiopsis tropica]
MRFRGPAGGGCSPRTRGWTPGRVPEGTAAPGACSPRTRGWTRGSPGGSCGSTLNVVENSHGIHGEILYGKTGELSSNRREEQELTMLALHILQACS